MAIKGAVKSISVYDISTRKEILTINPENDPSYIKISDDGKIVATGDFVSYTVKAWNVETGKLITKLDFKETVHAFGLSPDGRFLLGSDLSKTTIYDLKDDKISYEMWRYIDRYIFTKDSKFVLIPDARDIQVLELETNEYVAYLEHYYYVKELYLSDNGEYLLSSTEESVILWNLDNLYN